MVVILDFLTRRRDALTAALALRRVFGSSRRDISVDAAHLQGREIGIGAIAGLYCAVASTAASTSAQNSDCPREYGRAS
jgi:hypothetical protein